MNSHYVLGCPLVRAGKGHAWVALTNTTTFQMDWCPACGSVIERDTP